MHFPICRPADLQKGFGSAVEREAHARQPKPDFGLGVQAKEAVRVWWFRVSAEAVTVFQR